MRWSSVSDTAEYGDLTGPAGYLRADQAGHGQDPGRHPVGRVRQWVAEDDAGGPNFERLRREAAASRIERTGRPLRKMMAWVKTSDSDYVEGTAAR